MKYRATIYGDSIPFSYSFESKEAMSEFFTAQVSKGDFKKGHLAVFEEHDGESFKVIRKQLKTYEQWGDVQL